MFGGVQMRCLTCWQNRKGSVKYLGRDEKNVYHAGWPTTYGLLRYICRGWQWTLVLLPKFYWSWGFWTKPSALSRQLFVATKGELTQRFSKTKNTLKASKLARGKTKSFPSDLISGDPINVYLYIRAILKLFNAVLYSALPTEWR